MSNSLLSVKIIKSGITIEKLSFNEAPETEDQIKYMGVIKIGKMSTSHINLDDSEVSRMHGIIEHSNNEFTFTLMGKGETFLNEAPLKQNEKVQLSNEDVIKVGDLTLNILLGIDIHSIEEEEEESIREVVVNDLKDSNAKVVSASNILENEVSITPAVTRRATDKDIYFNNSVEDDIMLKQSIGKAIEIKHYWRGNLIDSKLFPNKSDVVTIGSELTDQFFVDSKLLPKGKSFKILENMGEAYFLKNNVKYIEGEDVYNLEELLQAQKAIIKDDNGAIRLLFRTKIGFEIGDNRIEISHVPLYKTAGKSVLAPILDGLNIKFSTLSTIIHFLIVFVIYLIPPELETFNIERLNKIPERYAKVILDVPKIEKVKKKVEFKNKVAKKDVEFNKNNNNSDFEFKSKDASKQLTQKQIETKKLVHSKGILGLKKGLGSGMGSGTYAGLEDDDIRLSSDTDISSSSAGTPSIRGGGSGPGGVGGSLGSGGPSTGGYRNTGIRGGGLGIKGGKKRSRKLIAKVGKDMISGNLTREQIQRVVNRNIDQIRYCYEKELLRKPDLKGNITILWKINPQGKVVFVKVDGATLKDNAVHVCMKAKINRWKFPEPKGGGYAQVRYPFNFRSN
jgi:pSer/pThr/pTyr-binding forkhead associated (FHA) protein